MTQYYRCQCGRLEQWGSTPPPRCLGCPNCHTTLAQHPDQHRKPEPHNYQPQQVETDQGTATLTVCVWCHQTKNEIEAAVSHDRT